MDQFPSHVAEDDGDTELRATIRLRTGGLWYPTGYEQER